MKKHIIMAAALAMTMGATLLTSCSDRIDEGSETSVSSLPTADKGYNGTYSYSKLDGSESVSLNINGETATITHDTQVSGEPNAQVVYQGDGFGYIKMNDNSLGVNEIPFVAGSNMVELKFAGTDMFSGNTVVLTQNGAVTRGSDDDDQEKEFMTPAAKSLVESLTKVLVKCGSIAIFGDYGDAISDPFLELAFGGDDSSQQQFIELEEKMDGLSKQLADMGDKMDMKALKDEFTNHWDYINNLKNHNQMYVDKIKAGNTSKAELLDQWARESVSSSSVESSLITKLQLYAGMSNIDWFNDLDEYLIRTHGFVQQSYVSRNLYREEDMKVFTKTMQLMREYLKSQNIGEDSKTYKNMTKAFNDYCKAASKSVFKQANDTIVCTIPGAYCTMHAAIKTKVLGDGVDWNWVNPYEKSVRNDMNDNYWDRDGKWINSYIYSDDGLKPSNKNIIKTKCLNKNQATAIVNYYGGKRNLRDILTNEAKMTGISNESMLLSDWCYADWSHYSLLYHDATARVLASVWDYGQNKYSQSYLETISLSDKREVVWDWGVVYRKWFVFKNHTRKSLDYTDKIIDDEYTTTGSFSDTATLMKYIKHIENRD